MTVLCFINPCLRPGAKSKYLPVGLAYVLTAVQKQGIEFDLIDMDANEITMDEFRKQIQTKHYDIYALGCIVTGLHLVRVI